ncbi:scabin-related ADP-ribosyltransferase [Micromonospora gifhornensis]|uniref:scabin-related ADP-ribosyltransferase n=1 Tax=Micromonospora gifhornensis TaxID=84594 RepID=UPI0019538132|nr:hypothetical protein [Micromonospora gifhornensis]
MPVAPHSAPPRLPDHLTLTTNPPVAPPAATGTIDGGLTQQTANAAGVDILPPPATVNDRTPSDRIEATHDESESGLRTPPQQPTAERLLAGLRAAARPAPAQGLLGPDIFGVRRTPPRPPFLQVAALRDLASDQLQPLLDRLDLATPHDRIANAVDDSQLSGGLVWTDVPTHRTWLENPNEVPPAMRELPATVDMPAMVHSIWLGGTPPDDHLENLAAMAASASGAGFKTHLWTDIPRADITRAMASDAPELAAVRQLVGWARRNQILLVNVDEVFHAGDPMDLDAQYRSEHAKQQGRGYGAASDILRIEILKRFGGVYTDGDNYLSAQSLAQHESGMPNWLANVDRLFVERGFGALIPPYSNARTYANAGFVGTRGHPFFHLYADRIAERYQRTQYELLPHSRTDREWSETQVKNKHMAARRHSIMARTGPDLLDKLARDLGFRASTMVGIVKQGPPLPTLDTIEMGDAGSWKAGSEPFAPRRQFQDEIPVLSRVAATLIRDLYNRDGDLHLTAVAPVVNGLPEPAAAWTAVVEFIAGHPDFGPLIRTVTDRVLVPSSANNGSVDTKVLPLPDPVRRRLGLTDEPGAGDPPGNWLRGELVRPARPTSASPVGPVTASAQSGTSGPGAPTQVFMADTTDSMIRGLDRTISERERDLRERGLDPSNDHLLRELRAHRASHSRRPRPLPVPPAAATSAPVSSPVPAADDSAPVTLSLTNLHLLLEHRPSWAPGWATEGQGLRLRRAATAFGQQFAADLAGQVAGRPVAPGDVTDFLSIESVAAVQGLANLIFLQAVAAAEGTFAPLPMRSLLPISEVIDQLDPVPQGFDPTTPGAATTQGAGAFLRANDGVFREQLARQLSEHLGRSIDAADLVLDPPVPRGPVASRGATAAAIEVELLRGNPQRTPLGMPDEALLFRVAEQYGPHSRRAQDLAERNRSDLRGRRNLRRKGDADPVAAPVPETYGRVESPRRMPNGVWAYLPDGDDVARAFDVLDLAERITTAPGTLTVTGIARGTGSEVSITDGTGGIIPELLVNEPFVAQAAQGGREHSVLVLRLLDDQRAAETIARQTQILIDRDTLLRGTGPRGVVVGVHDPAADRWSWQAVIPGSQSLQAAESLDEALAVVRSVPSLQLDPAQELRARVNGHTTHPGLTTVECAQLMLQGASDLPTYSERATDSPDSFTEKVLRVPVRPGATPAEAMETARLWLDPEAVREVVPRGDDGTVGLVRIAPDLRAHVLRLPATATEPDTWASVVRPAEPRDRVRYRVWVNRHEPLPGPAGPVTLTAVLPGTHVDWSVLDTLPPSFLTRLTIEPGRIENGTIDVGETRPIDAAEYAGRLPEDADEPIVVLQAPMHGDDGLPFAKALSHAGWVLVQRVQNGTREWRMFRDGELVEVIPSTTGRELGQALRRWAGNALVPSAQAVHNLLRGEVRTPDAPSAVVIRRAMAAAELNNSGTVRGWLTLPPGSGTTGPISRLLEHYPAGLLPLRRGPIDGQVNIRIEVPSRYIARVADRGYPRPIVDLTALTDARAVLGADGLVTVPAAVTAERGVEVVRSYLTGMRARRPADHPEQRAARLFGMLGGVRPTAGVPSLTAWADQLGARFRDAEPRSVERLGAGAVTLVRTRRAGVLMAVGVEDPHRPVLLTLDGESIDPAVLGQDGGQLLLTADGRLAQIDISVPGLSLPTVRGLPGEEPAVSLPDRVADRLRAGGREVPADLDRRLSRRVSITAARRLSRLAGNPATIDMVAQEVVQESDEQVNEDARRAQLLDGVIEFLADNGLAMSAEDVSTQLDAVLAADPPEWIGSSVPEEMIIRVGVNIATRGADLRTMAAGGSIARERRARFRSATQPEPPTNQATEASPETMEPTPPAPTQQTHSAQSTQDDGAARPRAIRPLPVPPAAAVPGDSGRSVQDTRRTPSPVGATQITSSTTVPTGEVPADGNCQLYSVIGADPQHVRRALAAHSLGSAEVRRWLNDPEQVRGDLQRHARSLSNDGIPVPDDSPLSQAADALRELVVRHLDSYAGRPGDIPIWVVQQYRAGDDRLLPDSADDRALLLGRLGSLGLTTVTDADLLPLDWLRDRFIARRTSDLVSSAGSQSQAREAAEREVPLTDLGRPDVNPRLADNATRKMRQMLEYLVERDGPLTVSEVPTTVLRGMLNMHYALYSGPVTPTEFDTMRNAATNWQGYWLRDEGETFLPLLADALGLRITIQRPQPHQPTSIGEEHHPKIRVVLEYLHYSFVPTAPAADRPHDDQSRPAGSRTVEQVSASPALAAAVDTLPTWDGTADCVLRVDDVLTRFAGHNHTRDDSPSRNHPQRVLATLGATRYQPVAVTTLTNLQPGDVTAVLTAIPNDPMHMVLVERRTTGELILIETQQTGSRRYARVDPTFRDLPSALAGPLRVPVTATGAVATLNPGPGDRRPTTASTDRTLHALLDPPSSSLPGMLSSGRRGESAPTARPPAARQDAASGPAPADSSRQVIEPEGGRARSVPRARPVRSFRFRTKTQVLDAGDAHRVRALAAEVTKRVHDAPSSTLRVIITGYGNGTRVRYFDTIRRWTAGRTGRQRAEAVARELGTALRDLDQPTRDRIQIEPVAGSWQPGLTPEERQKAVVTFAMSLRHRPLVADTGPPIGMSLTSRSRRADEPDRLLDLLGAGTDHVLVADRATDDPDDVLSGLAFSAHPPPWGDRRPFFVVVGARTPDDVADGVYPVVGDDGDVHRVSGDELAVAVRDSTAYQAAARTQPGGPPVVLIAGRERDDHLSDDEGPAGFGRILPGGGLFTFDGNATLYLADDRGFDIPVLLVSPDGGWRQWTNGRSSAVVPSSEDTPIKVIMYPDAQVGDDGDIVPNPNERPRLIELAGHDHPALIGSSGTLVGVALGVQPELLNVASHWASNDGYRTALLRPRPFGRSLTPDSDAEEPVVTAPVQPVEPDQRIRPWSRQVAGPRPFFVVGHNAAVWLNGNLGRTSGTALAAALMRTPAFLQAQATNQGPTSYVLVACSTARPNTTGRSTAADFQRTLSDAGFDAPVIAATTVVSLEPTGATIIWDGEWRVFRRSANQPGGLGTGRVPAADDVSGLSWWHPVNDSLSDTAELFRTRYPWVPEINADNRSAVSDDELVNCFYAAIALHQSWDGDQLWSAADPGGTAPWAYAINYANFSSGAENTRVLRKVSGYDSIATAYREQGATDPAVHGFVIVVEAGRDPHVHNVVGTPEGVLFIDSATGQPSSLPANPQHVIHIPIGDISVDVPGSPFHPSDQDGIRTIEDLSKLADEIAGGTRVVPADDPLTDPASCVALLAKAFGRLHPDRIAPIPAAARTVDDTVLNGRQTSRLVGGAQLATFGSWNDLESRLVEAAGEKQTSTALVLIERSKDVGHAIMAHRLPTGEIVYVDLHRDPRDRVLPPGQPPKLSSARASAVVLDANGVEIPPSGPTDSRTVDALIDPAADHRYGRGGTEAEYHGGYLDYPAEWEDDSGTPLAGHFRQIEYLAINHRVGLRAVIDSGTFMTREGVTSVAPPGVPEDDLHVEPIIEFVTDRPLAELPGDPGSDNTSAIRAQEDMCKLLGRRGDKALRSGFRGLGYTLDQIFDPAEGWDLHPDARPVRFVPVITHGQPAISMHHTKGVPIGAVKEFLANLTPRIWDRALQRRHLSGGSFAASIRNAYQTWYSPRFNDGRQRPLGRPTEDELNELEGAMWVTYDHVAGLAMAALTGGLRGKHLSPIAMRQSLRAMRNELTPETQRFLQENSRLIEVTFEATLLTEERDDNKRRYDYSRLYVENHNNAARQHAASPQYHQAPTLLPTGTEVRPLDAVRYARLFERHQRPTVSVREYLHTMLLDNAPQLNQHEAFGVRTIHNDLDRARPSGRGLLLFEIRNDTARLIHPHQILPQYQELRTIVQNAVARVEPRNTTVAARTSQFSIGSWSFAATGFSGFPPGTDTTPLPSAHTPEQVHQRFPFLRGVNPDRDSGTETRTNCVITAISYILSVDEGTVVEASGAIELPGADLINFQRQRLGLRDDEHRVWLTPSVEALTDALLAAGVGTQVFLADRGDNGHLNHVFVGVVDHLGVTYLDPQNGGLAALPATTTALAVLPLTHSMSMPVGGRMLTANEVGVAPGIPASQASPPAEASPTRPRSAARWARDVTGSPALWQERASLQLDAELDPPASSTTPSDRAARQVATAPPLLPDHLTLTTSPPDSAPPAGPPVAQSPIVEGTLPQPALQSALSHEPAPRGPLLRFTQPPGYTAGGTPRPPTPIDVLPTDPPPASLDFTPGPASTGPTPPTGLPSAQLNPAVDPTNIAGLVANPGNPSGQPQYRTDQNPVFRWDTRGPMPFANPTGSSEFPPTQPGIFNTGFQPQDVSNTDLASFVDGNRGAFVSTSRLENLNFLGGPSGPHGPYIFRFEIHAPGGVDVNASLGDRIDPLHRNQLEVAFPGGIRTENIRGARRVTDGGAPFMPVTLGPFLPNPNFNPGAPNPHFPAPSTTAATVPGGSQPPIIPLPLPSGGALPPSPGGPLTAPVVVRRLRRRPPPPKLAPSAPLPPPPPAPSV